jgi:hypothetical protein
MGDPVLPSEARDKEMPEQAAYPWTREGVAEAVDATMECWPRLREAFVVADAPGEGSVEGGTWKVRLDPHRDGRVARIRSDVVARGALQQIAQALRAAEPES